MKAWKRIGTVLGILAVILTAVFLMGRYGWKLGGFRACEGAGITSVEVSNKAVHITGFYPGSFPEGCCGCYAQQRDGKLYVGFRFSALFGLFETGDFDFSIPVKGEITEVIMKTGTNETPLWNARTGFLQRETTVPQEPAQVQPESGQKDETTGKPIQQDFELVGPWHLDREKNDLAAFADSLELFPGYGEWGAGMEIRSNGQMSWYIGAESWQGSYTLEDGVLQAQLVSDLDQTSRLWEFCITENNGVAELEMDYPDMTIYWAYGDREGF